MKNIIFIAPPASGKGTQSNFLEEKCGYKHLSTGDILREEISKKSTLGNEVKNIIKNGQLVGDEIITTILKEKISSLKGVPFVLDGSPRTMIQAKAIEKMFEDNNINNYVIIYLDINKEEAMKRALGRIVCSCGKSYNIYDENLLPPADNKCDVCGKTLLKRSDDTEEKFNERFDEYLSETKPVIDYYESVNKLVKVDASINPNVTFNKILEIIND